MAHEMGEKTQPNKICKSISAPHSASSVSPSTHQAADKVEVLCDALDLHYRFDTYAA